MLLLPFCPPDDVDDDEIETRLGVGGENFEMVKVGECGICERIGCGYFASFICPALEG
jgi:hypothetical protein